jgi:hypothetical protein
MGRNERAPGIRVAWLDLESIHAELQQDSQVGTRFEAAIDFEFLGSFHEFWEPRLGRTHKDSCMYAPLRRPHI